MKKEALLYDKLGNAKVHCRLCGHSCVIDDGKYGICGVRKNESGTLFTYVYGEVIASHVDPIEKKPLYHFLPGSSSFSIATVGCNFRCGFCQNWEISQRAKRDEMPEGYELKPEEVVREAMRHGARSISYTYTEPTIFFEYAFDTAELAKEKGLRNVFVTNGFMTKEAIDMIRPYLDAANIDLKSYSDEFYKKICKARLQPVLDSIRRMKETGVWVEITTLLVPGENDSEKELNDTAGFIASVGKDIPWHISRFHPDYEFTEHRETPLSALRNAREIGKKHGLLYVYMGNVFEGNDTMCHVCGGLLIKRHIFNIQSYRIEKNSCPSCGAKVPGVFD